MFKSPMVVGYKGEIGRFILAGLLEHLPKANDILCTDINNSDEDVIDRLEKSDYVFLCVPLQITADWLRRFKPHLAGRIIVEQSSVKSFLYENPEFETLRFLSMHLLFRPSATPLADRSGLLFSDRVDAHEMSRFADEIEATLQTPMFRIDSGTEPAHVIHDRHMARQQALAHRVLLVLSESLSEVHMRTFVGRRVAELADRIRAGDSTLYRLIQENPYLDSELEEFRERLKAFDPEV